MKRLILCALSCFCAYMASAQTVAEEPEQRHLVGLQLGSAFVNGDFNDSAFEDEYPAFARDGLLLAGSYRYTFHKFLAAGATLTYRHNHYNLDALVEPDDELVSSKSSEAWRSIFTLSDLYFRVPLQDVAEVYLKGSVGTSFNRSAAWQIQTEYGDIVMPAAKANALALGWGSGISYNVKPFVVNAEAGLLYTKPEFTVPDVKGNLFRHRQPMHTFNLSVGVQYRF